MEWKQIRAQYEREFTAAKKRGATQESVAKAGGLRGQNVISKVMNNAGLGPQVETFVRAVEGLGISVSAFFAHIEQLQSSSLTAASARTLNPDPLEQAIHHAGVPFSAADEETWTKIGRAIGRGLVREVHLAQSREQAPNPRARKPGRGTRHRKDR